MKKMLLFLFVTGSLLLSAMMVFATYEFRAPGPLTSEKIVLIPKGTGIVPMAMQLQSENVIGNPWLFVGFSRVTGTYKKLQAGEYRFLPDMRMGDVLYKIARGDIYKRSFTIPEGKTSFEIVGILKKTDGLSGEIAQTPKEGSVLPETYSYMRGDTRADKIKFMQAQMEKTINELWSGRDSDLPFSTIDQAITLASIVEKETGVPEERKRVAGVFINRLKIGMPLQSDPTVIYGITKGENKNEGQGPLGRRLLSADLEAPSPYNTYLNPGLPPGPIANPGRASIEAVLHPEQNNFLFFVADGKGGHVFAATLEEHNKNVAAWRELRKEKD